MIDFTEEELQRYSRHILLQEVGAEGQERIRRGRVLVIGVGWVRVTCRPLSGSCRSGDNRHCGR